MSTCDPVYWKKYRLDRHRGAPSRYGDAQPVREHVNSLLAAGTSRLAIAEAADVSPTTIMRLLQGQVHMRRVIAQRIVQVQLRDTLRRDSGTKFVPVLGSRRRVQALMAIGHGHAQIAAAAGDPRIDARAVSNCQRKTSDWISQTLHDGIACAYRILSAREGASSITKKTAARQGFLSPMAWDNIDDPVETGAEIAPNQPAKPGRPPLVDVADVECLITHQAYTREGLEARLGASWNTIYVACRRAGRQDLTDQIVTHTPGAADRCPQVADRVKTRAS